MQERWNKLVELNAVHQVFNVCTSPVVQQAWDAGQPLAVHGLVYSLTDGLLKELTPPITSLDDLEHYSDKYGEEQAVGTGALQRKDSYADMRALTKAMVTHMGFERAALARESMDRTRATAAGGVGASVGVGTGQDK